MTMPRAAPVNALLCFALANTAACSWLAFGGFARSARLLLHGYVVVDATARLFLMLVALVFLGIATYIWTGARSEPAPQNHVGRYVACASAFVLASEAAIVSHHLLLQWVFLEATTLAAVPLIQQAGGPDARSSSWKYFLFSGVGLALTFLGFACMARGIAESGGHPAFFLDQLHGDLARSNDAWRRLGLVFVLVGFGTKLGLAPMYSWLPYTYDDAPPSATALLAAVQFNVALVALMRVLGVAAASDARLVSGVLVSLGLATMAVSSFHMIAARNYKKLIAYAALNHGGVIAVGLGIGASAAYGVVLYAVSNAFIKAILFLTAGKIRAHYKTEQIAEVSGLIKDLPYSGLFFMIGTFALLGFPPFGSFLGELLVMSALVGEGYVMVFAAFCSILTVTFVATGRAVFPMIWGEPKKRADWSRQQAVTMLPKLAFMVALVAMGLYLPPPINDLFRAVAAELGAL